MEPAIVEKIKVPIMDFNSCDEKEVSPEGRHHGYENIRSSSKKRMPTVMPFSLAGDEFESVERGNQDLRGIKRGPGARPFPQGRHTMDAKHGNHDLLREI